MEFWLPLIFAGVCGLSLLLYVILDGYDLGVGLLLPFANAEEKDVMVASIGPFWDANETWIVLGVGILLIAFPEAHGAILTSLYLPATLMLMGLVLRGVAFDFRIKAATAYKYRWNALFSAGSMLAALCQGWMLGSYITGLTPTPLNVLFALMTAFCLPVLYLMLGAVWLMGKTAGTLPVKAARWARRMWLPLGFSLLVISIATPLVSAGIAAKWFTLPALLYLLPIPLSALLCYSWLGLALSGRVKTRPLYIFAAIALICVMAAAGLGYSIYPDIIIGQLGIHEAAAATESLLFAFWGVAVTLPLILGYTWFIYRIFSGNDIQQHYD
ncbi:MAG: cytochrome d ubiquinol oxidase subunit II [Pseudomonadota bacterium]